MKELKEHIQNAKVYMNNAQELLGDCHGMEVPALVSAINANTWATLALVEAFNDEADIEELVKKVDGE